MEKETKLETFEFIVFQLIKWYNEINGIDNLSLFNERNDLSKLKLIKLHFFVVAINARESKLLKTFDKFHAMPLGHVESDIYSQLLTTKRYNIGSSRLEIKPHFISDIDTTFLNSDKDLENSILDSIKLLKKTNFDLINYSAMMLVELSHSWISWKETFKNANESGKLSAAIPEKLILEENKIFHFQ